MKFFIHFTDTPKTKVPASMRVLGEAWESNKDFYISIDNGLDSCDKLDTFIEEIGHVLIRIIGKICKKKLTITKEHTFCRELRELFNKYGLKDEKDV